MDDCRSSKVNKALLDILYNEKEADVEYSVASAIGRLMYLVVTTRLGLCGWESNSTDI